MLPLVPSPSWPGQEAGAGGSGGDAAEPQNQGGAFPPGAQGPGGAGLPAGASLSGLGDPVPLPLARGRVDLAVRGGPLWAADGFGGAPVFGTLPPGLPAGPLGEADPGERRARLAGGWAGGGALSPAGDGPAGSPGGASAFGSLAPAFGERWVFMRGIGEVQVLS